MNKSKIQQKVINFILRRAFRHEKVCRGDILKAFDLSPASATRLMSTAVARKGAFLERRGHSIFPKPWVDKPTIVSEEDLLAHLDSGKNAAEWTGLFDEELPITYVSWTNSVPQKNGVLQTIVTAIDKKKQLDIIYIGLKFDERPKKRKILPLSLEKMNDQWRVIAQDLEDSSFPTKVFVLPRILDATISLKTTRIPYGKGYTDYEITISISLNYRYTREQKQVLANELKIQNNEVKISSRSEHEFKRRFTDAPASENACWPPLVLKDK